MKVVLDTNILVSGLMTRGGNSALILDHVVDGNLTLCADDRILREYQRVCLDPRLCLDPEAVNMLLSFVHDTAVRVVPHPLNARLPDPDDLPFIEVAITSKAALVTGNKKHFPAPCMGAVKVLSPAEFIALLRVSKF